MAYALNGFGAGRGPRKWGTRGVFLLGVLICCALVAAKVETSEQEEETTQQMQQRLDSIYSQLNFALVELIKAHKQREEHEAASFAKVADEGAQIGSMSRWIAWYPAVLAGVGFALLGVCWRNWRRWLTQPLPNGAPVRKT